MKEDLFLVHRSVVPEIIIKVTEAKTLLASGREKTVSDAVGKVGISRSAFYKYKDTVFPFYDNARGRKLTLAINLDNVKGVLSAVLNAVAGEGANILTINQTIPINDTANVTITIETGAMDDEPAVLVETLEKVEGVQSLKIIAID